MPAARVEAIVMSEFLNGQCTACRRGDPALSGSDLASYHRNLGGGWQVVDDHHLEKEYAFGDFADALAFTNRVGALAEQHGHHPEIQLAWGKVRVSLWTYKSNGLTEADFALASQIERLS